MKHPSQEEWIAYIYDECAPPELAQLKRHLDDCPACREQVRGWQGTMTQLDTWQLPAAPRRPQFTWGDALKWGIAAMLMIGLGFGLARVTARPPDLAALRAELEPALRKQLAGELQTGLAAMATEVQTERAQDRQAIGRVLARMDQLQQQHAGDYAALRKEIETLAVNAENRFENTQEQLVQLAAYTEPAARTP